MRIGSYNYLGAREVIDLHNVLVDFFKDSDDLIDPPGVKDMTLLESALTRPMTAMGKVEKFKTFPLKCAALTHSLVNNHAFHNGNKRTALATLVFFCAINDRAFEMDEEEVFHLLIKIAVHGLGPDSPDGEVRAISEKIRPCISQINLSDITVDRLETYARNSGCSVITRGTKTMIRNLSTGRRVSYDSGLRELKGQVVKRYLSNLQISRTHTGNDNCFSGIEADPHSIVRKFEHAMRKLSSYDRDSS